MTTEDIIALLLPHTNGRLRIDAWTPVLSTGVLDSYHFAAFLEAMRAKTGMAIDVAAVGVDNFDTPTQMLAFLREQR